MLRLFSELVRILRGFKCSFIYLFISRLTWIVKVEELLGGGGEDC